MTRAIANRRSKLSLDLEKCSKKTETYRRFGFYFERGVQYESKKFTNILNFYKKHRESSKGNYWTNAVAESFLKYLKPELIYGNKSISKEQLRPEIVE
jgi:hypothetical protein